MIWTLAHLIGGVRLSLTSKMKPVADLGQAIKKFSAERVIVREAPDAPIARMQLENSEVLPKGSVAVAVMPRPVAITCGIITLKPARPLPSLLTSSDAKNSSPCPSPFCSHVLFEKNSNR